MAGPLFWLRFAEVYITRWLLTRPGWHRFVETCHRQFYRIRHGKPPEELGGTNLDEPGKYNTVLKHFQEEIQNQFRDFRGASRGLGPGSNTTGARPPRPPNNNSRGGGDGR